MKHINNLYLRTSALALAVAAVSVAGLGCETEDMNEAQEEMQEADARVGAAAAESSADLAEEAGDALEEAEDSIADKAAEAKELMEEMDGMSIEQIASLSETDLSARLEQVQDMIGEGNLDGAKSMLEKLGSAKDMLPASIQEKITAAEALLEKAVNMKDAAGVLGQ